MGGSSLEDILEGKLVSRMVLSGCVVCSYGFGAWVVMMLVITTKRELGSGIAAPFG